MEQNAMSSGEKQGLLYRLNLPEDIKQLTPEQCTILCKEIRSLLIATVSKTGGHLASNLGAVELTVAMHRVFSSPEDKFVWDVGHQCYTHKILTGRLKQFSTLRQEDGISGFPKPKESVHDTFISGHSSTAISVAAGVAEAMHIRGDISHYAVAVVGDGAMTGGLSYEGMNNAGKTHNNLIVILNDNEMSISRNVGSIARYFSSFRNKEGYVRTKKKVERKLTNANELGASVAKAIKKSKSALREVMIPESTMFEDMGFAYLGPIDGHNLQELEETLSAAKQYHRPVFVHIHTVKGKGYEPAEVNPGSFHGVSRFDVETGNPEISTGDSYSDEFGRELTRLAKKDPKICAITAAMGNGTGLHHFAKELPRRYYDVGIAEQYAVTFSAALAAEGMLPVFAVYSSFLQRAYDQLMHDVAIGNYHVVLGVDRAGVVGEDGETHHGLFDVSYLTSIPGATIYSPSCYAELRYCLSQALYHETGLVCVRYPRGKDDSTFDKSNYQQEYVYSKTGTAETLYISYGRTYEAVYHAHMRAKLAGANCDLLKLTKIFPIADEIIAQAVHYKKIVFLEESYYYGGIGQQFATALLEAGFRGEYVQVAPKSMISQASVASQLAKLGLSEDAVYRRMIQDEVKE